VVSFTPRPLYPLYPPEYGTHLIGSLVSPKADFDDVEKILDPARNSESEPSVIQSVASRYTDYAIPAYKCRTINKNMTSEFTTERQND
jgi:hypothetical protein